MAGVTASGRAPSAPHRAAAWGVHLLTASGAVVALLTLEAIYEGRFSVAFRWMVVAYAIDAADGTLARVLGVKNVVPQFDGARLDDIIDYLNYTVVPVALIVAAGLLPSVVVLPVSAAVLIASAYGFCHVDAKTSDGYFRGFPSYWNVVAFYLFTLKLGPWVCALVLVGLAVLVFLPVYFVYPTKATRFKKTTIVLGILWALATIVAIAQLPNTPAVFIESTLLFPAYYFALSLYLTLLRKRAALTRAVGP